MDPSDPTRRDSFERAGALHEGAPSPALPGGDERGAFRPKLARGATIAAIVGLPLASAYASVWIHAYAFSDDWVLLDEAQRRVHEVRDAVIAGGRPILALMLGAGFRLAGSVSGLSALRATAVAGIVALVCALATTLVRSGWRRADAALVAVAVGCIPSLREYAAWTVCFAYPWAALAAWGAARALEAGASPSHSIPRPLAVTIAVVLLTSAFLTYQPAAGFFWIPIGIALISRPRRQATSLAMAALVYAIGAGVGLTATRVGSALFPARSPRNALTTDPVAKALWFVRGPLVDALNLGSLTHSAPVAVLAGAAVILGLCLDAARSRRSALGSVLVAASVLVLAFSPNLAARESWTSYRTQLGLGAWVVVLAAYATRGLCAALRGGPTAVRAALVGCAGAGLLAASHAVQAYMVMPQVIERAWLRHQLMTPAALEAERIEVIPAGWVGPLAPAAHYDEFGLASFATTWAPAPAIAISLRELGRKPLPVRVIGRDAAPPAPSAGVFVLDARELNAIR